jgi:predicted DNA-binding protein (MmcQ/YjbR family)
MSPSAKQAKKPARPRAKKPAKLRVSTHPPKKRTRTSLALIAKLRKICLAHPDATEQVAWGEPTWRVNGRLFAQLDDHHHGAKHVSVWLPAPEGAQAALIEAEPARIFRPPYVGPAGWIGVILDTDPDWAMVEALVAQAYELIASRKRRR